MQKQSFKQFKEAAHDMPLVNDEVSTQSIRAPEPAILIIILNDL